MHFKIDITNNPQANKQYQENSLEVVKICQQFTLANHDLYHSLVVSNHETKWYT